MTQRWILPVVASLIVAFASPAVADPADTTVRMVCAFPLFNGAGTGTSSSALFEMIK